MLWARAGTAWFLLDAGWVWKTLGHFFDAMDCFLSVRTNGKSKAEEVTCIHLNYIRRSD